MANMIIVPLSGAFIAGAIGPAASDTELDISAMVWVANGTPSLSATGGSGTGAVATVTITAGAKTATTLTFTAGSGYKVGDVLTIEGNTTNFTGSITLTVVEDNLLGGEDTGIITAPTGGQFLCVVPPTSGSGYTDPQILQIESGHERIWAITITGGSATNYKSVATNIDKVMKEAMQSPNSNPVLDLSSKVSGVAVSSVALT